MIRYLKKIEIYDWFTLPAVLVWITHPIGWILALMYITEIPFRFILTQDLVRFKKYVIWHKRLFGIPQVIMLGLYLSYISKSSNAYLNYGYIAILVWIIVSVAVTTWVKTNREFVNQTVNGAMQLLATGVVIIVQGVISFQKPLLSEIGIICSFVIVYGILTIPIGLVFLQTKYRRILVLSRLVAVFILGVLFHIYV
jgi:hypothetical protein